MQRIAYVNGRYVPYGDASVSIDDRGLQFGDSVYEVIAIRNGALIEYEDHLARLSRSLDELRIAAPVSDKGLCVIVDQIRRRNYVRDGLIYIQVTRGVAPRAHKFPSKTVRASLIVTGKQRTNDEQAKVLKEGVSVITRPDLRWQRRDIKSTNLLANVLAKQEAADAGATEAWLVDADGFITEGTSSSAWIVSAEGGVITRPLSHDILPGVTRLNLIRAIHQQNIAFEERAFTLEEAEGAAEAFLTSANNPVTPVVSINARKIGDGKPGLVTRLLQERYHATLGAT